MVPRINLTSFHELNTYNLPPINLISIPSPYCNLLVCCLRGGTQVSVREGAHSCTQLEVTPPEEGVRATLRARRLTGNAATRVRMKWAVPQLALCFPVSDQGQRGSVWTHWLRDISCQLHMTLKLLKQAAVQKNNHYLPFSHTPTHQTQTVSPSERAWQDFTAQTENVQSSV